MNTLEKANYRLVYQQNRKEGLLKNLYECDIAIQTLKEEIIELENGRTITHDHHCSKCPQVFRTMRGLNNHFAHMHLKEPITVGPYKCPNCERCYTSSTGMRIHLKRVHGVFLRYGARL